MAMTRSTYLKLFPRLVLSRLVRIRRSVLYSRPIDSCSSFVFDLNRSLCARSLRPDRASSLLWFVSTVLLCPDRSPCLDCFRLKRQFSFVSTVSVCLDRSPLSRPFSFRPSWSRLLPL